MASFAQRLLNQSTSNTHIRFGQKIISVAVVMLSALLFTALLGLSPYSLAQNTPDSIFNDSPSFLKVDEAFGFEFQQKGDLVVVKWDIAEGYYLYKKQFKTATKGAVIGQASYPAHEQIEDEFFGTSDVFFKDMEMSYPIIQANKDGSIKLRYQGCAKAGLCYPPTTKVIFLDPVESSYLLPEQAFTAALTKSNRDEIEFTLSSADNYFITQDNISIDAITHELGEPTFSKSVSRSVNGETKNIFLGQATVTYPILSIDNEAESPPIVELSYVGCANENLCYQASHFKVNLDEPNEVNDNNSQATELVAKDDDTSAVSSQFALADRLLSDQSIFVSLGILALLGLGLAFTPCVYPMYPILSSIVIGKGKKEIKTSHAFALSFVYVQGMAITYSVLGLIVASAGLQFQAALQHPVLLSVFIVLFVALALAMFGLYEIQMPSKWQGKLNSLSDGQKQGNYLGVFVMGVVSGLVASPCTTAPLTAVLIVVAQSDSLVFGFFSLYALSIGMGIPLILFGITGGKLLPKAGAWMNVIKVTFGFMMLTVAILFVERFIIAAWTDLLWAALGLSLFAYWYTVNQNTQTSFAKGVRTLVSISGLVVAVLFTVQTLQKIDLIPHLIGATNMQNEHINKGQAQSHPEIADAPNLANANSMAVSQQAIAALDHVNGGQAQSHPEFIVVRNLADFEIKLMTANQQGKTVMVDLFADWCVACKEFEKYTFPKPQVIEALSQTVWMQIDLTDNTPNNLAFQEAFGIFGLPTIMFFDNKGEELTRSRVTGFMKADAFAAHVKNTLPKN